MLATREEEMVAKVIGSRSQDCRRSKSPVGTSPQELLAFADRFAIHEPHTAAVALATAVKVDPGCVAQVREMELENLLRAHQEGKV